MAGLKIRYAELKKLTRQQINRFEGRVNTAQEKVQVAVTGQEPRTPISQVQKRIPVEAGQHIVIDVESVANNGERGAALFAVKALNDAGEAVKIEEWETNSAKVGHYFYLTPSENKNPVHTQAVVPIPSGATVLELQGHQWKQGNHTSVIGEVISNVAGGALMTAKSTSGADIAYPSSSLKIDREIPAGVNRVEVVFSHKAVEEKSSAPVLMSFKDAEGKPLPPIAELAQSPALGPFVPLNGEKGVEEQTSQVLEIPQQAASLHLEGVDWGKKTPVITAPVELLFPTDELTVTQFIQSIPNDEPLIIIDTTAPPLGHKTLSLRPNNLTMAYERLGAWVIFIPFGSIQDQVHHHSERVFQIDRANFDHMIQTAVENRDPRHSYFICSSFPSLQSLASVNYLRTRGWGTMYECRDDMEEFNRVGYSKWYSTALERGMLLNVDQVVSVSTALDQKLLSMAPAVKIHDVIPNAVNQHVIDTSAHLRTEEALAERQESNLVGYVGHLTESWFDWPAIEEVANRLPHLEFEIIGHGAPDNLVLPSNVKLLGAKSHEELPEIVARWKVALIPFKDMPLTRSVDPNKIYEYFAWGLRCVTAPMGMVEKYPSTWVYQNVDEFVSMLDEASSSEFTPGELDTLREFVKTASWDDRAHQMFEKLGITFTAKDEDQDA